MEDENADIIMEDDLIIYLNHKEKYTITELSKIWNMNYIVFVRKCKKKYKIKLTNWNSEPKTDIESELLESLYWGNQYSQEKIAEKFGCDRRTIENLMKRFNIPARSASEFGKLTANSGQFKKGKRNNPTGEFKKGAIPDNYIHIEKELLESLYLGNQYSVTKIAKLLNISIFPICDKLMKYGIPIRSHSESMEIIKDERSGKNASNWKGGVTPLQKLERNSIKFKKWREGVFKRDNWTCQYCHDYSRKGHGIKLNAHHIKAFADYPTERLNINNGITLCEDCHMYIHHRFNVLSQQ